MQSVNGNDAINSRIISAFIIGHASFRSENEVGRGSQHAEVELRNTRNAARFFFSICVPCAISYLAAQHRDRVREAPRSNCFLRIIVDALAPTQHLFVILLISKRNGTWRNTTVIELNPICC